jgi:hypothetical protein
VGAVRDRRPGQCGGGYAIPNARDSGLRALGVDSASTPPWDRAAQILLGFGLSAAAVCRGRWPAVVLICTAVRVGLDPNDYPYYDAGPVVGALIWDLIGARRAMPAWTLAAGSLFWGWTTVLGNYVLAGDLRIGFAVAAVGYTIIGPAGVPQIALGTPVASAGLRRGTLRQPSLRASSGTGEFGGECVADGGMTELIVRLEQPGGCHV